MIGDELRLKHSQTIDGSELIYEGRIVKIPDSKSRYHFTSFSNFRSWRQIRLGIVVKRRIAI